MLALAWQWADHPRAKRSTRPLAERLGASLCAGIGGHSGVAQIDRVHFAYRPIGASQVAAQAWRPTILPSGRIIVFHGYFDNAAAIASELGTSASNLARLYGLAVEQLGDAADSRIIGEYAAVVVDAERTHLRLSRSPLRAPPLCYSQTDQLVALGSVPRVLFAAGIKQQLNEDRVADTAMINFSDREASWFHNVSRVPLGSIVELQPSRPRVLREYYDLFARPNLSPASDDQYIARASELLNEGVRACLAGFTRPGATLSSGLDSPQVAVRTLAALPPTERLPTFTFHPEPGFDGRVQAGMSGDERPFVEAFAAMHPRLEPHFTANTGYGHDYRWNDFFHLMGGAPSGLCNMYVFHGLFAGAAAERCDVLLLAEWGNFTFSDKGDWGFVEYLLTGRWRQLWRALAARPQEEGSMLKRFILRSLSALLPLWLWRPLRKLFLPHKRFPLDLIQPLSREYRISSGAERRLKQSKVVFDRFQPWNRRHAQQLLFQNNDGESDEIYQAFEQMYGVPQRDPMAYRPFVEFCFGLPVRMFMRDGQLRWMAKEMARGIMPEAQRVNRLNGRWDADWHLRLGRRRDDFLAELERIGRDPGIASKLDLPRLRAALEDWPDQTEIDPQLFFAREFTVPRGLLTARFIKYIEGRNDA